MDFKIDKQDFLNKGFCVIKNLLNKDEVTYYDEKIKKLANNSNHFSLGGIYNERKFQI